MRFDQGKKSKEYEIGSWVMGSVLLTVIRALFFSVLSSSLPGELCTDIAKRSCLREVKLLWPPWFLAMENSEFSIY